ncbi:DUF3024 domain-containing protein [Paenibacillus sp. NPDC058071]|uniref:DUF3024 domain-containing protein n=1 Tax=Paenibacillus sp. NPDC058071 TaxID=3346326 RepID=UPI0036D9D1FE
MPLDAFTKKRIEKIMDEYAGSKFPKHLSNQIRISYKIRGNNVTLCEERPAYIGDGWTQLDVAQFRLADSKWLVYWRDSKDKWHLIEDIEPSEDFQKQLAIVDKNEIGIFWY